MNIPEFNQIVEQNDQTEARLEHLESLRKLVGNVYPNKFDRSAISGGEDTITNLLKYPPVASIVAEMAEIRSNLAEGERPPAEIKDALNLRLREFGTARIAGRLAVPPRVMGKAAFVHLSDGISRMQVYVRRDDVEGVWNGSEPPALAGGEPAAEFEPSAKKTSGRTDLTENMSNLPPANAGGSDPNGWEIFKLLDHGDFIGVEGYLFITNTGELSVHVEKLQFLAKAMVPMPDKMHGIADPELRRRYRYVDLIGSSLQVKSEPPASAGGESSSEQVIPELTTREVFERRAKIISSMRRYLEDHGYIEVETPMLTPKATGAAAEPFETYHKALDIPLYARIAPELYLKRLMVGGFEKVYELNRNFRNEGLSHKHNPEFTMLEFYCAYMDVNGMMDFCEEMLKKSVLEATGFLTINYEGHEIDFATFDRIPMRDTVANWFSTRLPSFQKDWLKDVRRLQALNTFSYHFKAGDEKYLSNPDDAYETCFDFFINNPSAPPTDRTKDGELVSEERLLDGVILQFFEDLVESDLIQPTFVTDYPKSISPLSKASPQNPAIAERFELFIGGIERANGFSELNDPREQYERFVDQMKERESGDAEAMLLDEDYINALSYGMPPAAGIGIGIDRIVMLLTNKHSIRDVILFPHMRPGKKEHENEEVEKGS